MNLIFRAHKVTFYFLETNIMNNGVKGTPSYSDTLIVWDSYKQIEVLQWNLS